MWVERIIEKNRMTRVYFSPFVARKVVIISRAAERDYLLFVDASMAEFDESSDTRFYLYGLAFGETSQYRLYAQSVRVPCLLAPGYTLADVRENDCFPPFTHSSAFELIESIPSFVEDTKLQNPTQPVTFTQ